MKLVDIITQAQVIAGINSFEGNAVDVNQMATSLAIFHQTLNSINNDPKIILVQAAWDYQRDKDGESVSDSDEPDSSQWVNVPQLNSDEPSLPDTEIELLFPDYETPFAIGKTYPLPSNCRRVLKVISGPVELRKTDYSEIIKSQKSSGMTNLYAVNNKKIELVFPGKIKLVYVKEFKEFMPQDEVDLPLESIDYVINLLSYNLALSFNSSRVGMCQTLAEKSYNALLGNLRVNEGEKFQSIYNSLNRFMGGGGHWL